LAKRVRQVETLDQRIAVRCTLQPLADEEVPDYMAHRLQVAGREESIFDLDAIDLICGYADGIPRKINNICDIALVIGFSRKLKAIDADWMQRLIQAENDDGV